VAGGDDTRWLAETLTRRFAHVEASPDAGSRPRRFAYPPQLVVVDGGAPQVEAAADALRLLGVEVALCGLAKRLEEVWLPGEPEPVVLSRTSEGLYLLQRIRDEAHRFAITYHRQKRSRSMVSSALDGVPGLGEVRRRALLTRFGSLRRLRAASVEEIAGVPGIGPATAEAVVAALSAGGVGDPAVDPRTGEVVG
jgi:excinuclease ABC subunit C